MGLELELLSAQLPPIRTTATARTDYGDGGVEKVDAVYDGEVCSTPTAAANVLRPPSVCPPAPRKPRPHPPATTKRRKKKHARCFCHCGRRSGAPARWRSSFVAVPDDLAKVFVPRRPSPSTTTTPCRHPPDGKKIRVHVVG